MTESFCKNALYRVTDRTYCVYGASSVPLNGAALGALISITYAWSVKDEELSFSPPRGARTHGLPVMADWKSGSQLLSHPHRLSLQRRVVFSDCGCHLLRHALVCMTAYHLLVVIGLFA